MWRVKSLLATSKLVRMDERVADIYVSITKTQENRIRLRSELKQNVTTEVKMVAQEEVKALAQMYAFDYYDVASKTAVILFLGK